MSISTLVLIVLAIIVLVLIVIAATGGFSKVGDFFSNLGGGKSNVQTVIQGCQVACQTGSVYDYCERLREVRLGKDETIVGVVDKQRYTCSQLTGFNVQGLTACATISCATLGGVDALAQGTLVASQQTPQLLTVRLSNVGSEEIQVVGISVPVSSYSSWASLVRAQTQYSVDNPLTFSTSQDVSFDVTLKPGVSGDQTFQLDLQISGQTISESVSVQIR